MWSPRKGFGTDRAGLLTNQGMASGDVINRLKESSHWFLNSGKLREDLQNQQYESSQLEQSVEAWKIQLCFAGYLQKENTAHNEGKSVKQRQNMQLLWNLALSFGFPQILRFFTVTHRFFCIFCLVVSHPSVFLKVKMLLLLNNHWFFQVIIYFQQLSLKKANIWYFDLIMRFGNTGNMGCGDEQIM